MKKSEWTTEQIDQLLEKAKRASNRSRVFAEIAKNTGKKPNSVRNLYYKLTAEKQDIKVQHKKHVFVPFSKEQTKSIIREIVLGSTRGLSVRSVCMAEAKGDKAKMLRYQNKYRATLQKNPVMIEKIVKELESQGYFVKNPLVGTQQKKPLRTDNIIQMPINKNYNKLSDSDINNLFMGIVRLVKKHTETQIESSFKTQIEMLKNEIQRLKSKMKSKTI